MRQFFLACFCLAFFTAGVPAQTVRSADLLKRILDLPAPPPVNSEEIRQKRERPPEFFEPGNIPPDDAPVEDLLDYWEKQNSAFDEFRYNQRPSPETLKRILGEIERDPALLLNYIRLLPPEPEAAAVVKRIFQAENRPENKPAAWPEVVRLWLRNNSDLFIDELTESAKNVKLENKYIPNQQDLIALAKVDWDRALPIVTKLENNPQEAELYTLAKYVLYHHAVKNENSSDIERYRSDLKKLVENKKASHKTRDLAMDALVLGGDFGGREEWYLSLLEDETLLELQENGFTGLTTLVRFLPNDRQKWRPAMLRLLDSANPTLRSVAVRNLLQISGFDDKELLVKLLPWLPDPAWAKASRDNERQDFIQALARTELPESVPGLIALVSNAGDPNRMDAARTLVRYKSVEAVAVLRRLLLSEENYEMRAGLIEALVAVNGFSDEELIDGLEAFIVETIKKTVRREAREDSDEEDEEDEEGEERPVSIPVSIGAYLREYTTPGDGLVRRTIERIAVLQKTDPPAAAMMLDIMEKWDHPLVDLEMLGWLASEKANPETVLKLLVRRAELRERVPSELSAMREKNGLLRALGAAILEDKAAVSDILNSPETEARVALLAFARLVRWKLPVGAVGTLLKNDNKLVALAAERYLEADDSLEARTLILAHFKGAVRILGAHHAFVPDEKDNFETLQPLLNNLFESVNQTAFGNLNLARINKTEKSLRREIADNPELLGVYGFIENHTSSSQLVRLYKNKIVFTYNEDDARYWEKTLTPKEFEALTGLLIEKGIDYLAPLDIGAGPDSPAGEFLMFGRDGGRRVFYQSFEVPDKLDTLAEMFESFNQGERRLRYRLADRIGGLEVLFADEELTAAAVWKEKADFRVLIADSAAREAISEDLTRQEKLENNGGTSVDRSFDQKQKERRAAAAYKHFSWRAFAAGKLGAERVDEPSEIKYLANNRQGDQYSYLHGFSPEPVSFRRQLADGEVLEEQGDLYKVDGSGARTLFKKGVYDSPVVSADKKWIIAASAEQSFYYPNGVVRINLQTGREFPVNLPPADDFYAIAAVPAQNKVLLVRKKDPYRYQKNNPSPATPEYHLLDPNTGAVRPARGDFRPLENQTFRGLQPSAAPNEFWAALYDEKEGATRIGLYNMLNFSFKPLMTLPAIALDSMNIWVDEPAAKIYFVYGGHLLAVPLAGK